MTVIRPNSISGVSSITGNGGDISIFRADGTAADVTINNITSGVITAIFRYNWNDCFIYRRCRNWWNINTKM